MVNNGGGISFSTTLLYNCLHFFCQDSWPVDPFVCQGHRGQSSCEQLQRGQWQDPMHKYTELSVRQEKSHKRKRGEQRIACLACHGQRVPHISDTFYCNKLWNFYSFLNLFKCLLNTTPCNDLSALQVFKHENMYTVFICSFWPQSWICSDLNFSGINHGEHQQKWKDNKHLMQ